MGEGSSGRLALQVDCPGCGEVFAVAAIHLGRTGRCPRCETPLRLEGGLLPVAPAPAPLTRRGPRPLRWPRLLALTLIALVALALSLLGGCPGA